MTVMIESRLESELATASQGKKLLVLDYDGTIAYLAVDWTSVRRDLARVAANYGFKSQFRPLFGEIARFRDEVGADHLPALFRSLAQHEEIGVDGQQPRHDVLDAVRNVTAKGDLASVVFSVNLHRTIENGLARVSLQAISAIVGADDVTHWKPDPEGLNLLLGRAGVKPSEALFVGDSQRDADAARAATVDFYRV